MKYFLLLLVSTTHYSTEADSLDLRGIYPVQMDEDEKPINEVDKYVNQDLTKENTSCLSKEGRNKKHTMTRLERAAAKKYLFEKFMKKERKRNKTNLFEQVREYNKKKGYLLAKGTCDRRGVKVCKNACVKTYRQVCAEAKCKHRFKEEIKKNCRKECDHKFKKEFHNIF